MKKIKISELDLKKIIKEIVESQLLTEACKQSNNVGAQREQNWVDCGGGGMTCGRKEYGNGYECQKIEPTGGDEPCCPPVMKTDGTVVDCCKNRGVGTRFKNKQGASDRLERFMRTQGLNERYGDESTRDTPPIDTGSWACHSGKGECVNQNDASGGLYGDEKRYRGLFAKWRCNKNCG